MWDLEKILTVSAAWVQAVGSIIALVVAFMIAGRQSARDDRRRQLDAADWRSGLHDLAEEAALISQLAAVPHDGPSGRAFAAAYDPVYSTTVIELLTARINSEKIPAACVKPAVKVLAEFAQLHSLIESYLPRFRVGQISLEMRGDIFERHQRIAIAAGELRPEGKKLRD